jgi:hypothetical protein
MPAWSVLHRPVRSGASTQRWSQGVMVVCNYFKSRDLAEVP